MLAESVEHFARCGAGERECVVYWTGPRDRPDFVDQVIHPVHKSTRFSYEVDSDWVTKFFLILRDDRRAARIQLHTHPGEACHSQTDDRFALVPAPGFLSLVIPDFAGRDNVVDGAFLAEMTQAGTWVEIPIGRLSAS